MSETKEKTSRPPRDEVDPTRVRYLTPDMCHIHLGTHEALHVTVLNERIYGGVYAAYAFPVANPNRYISLIHTGGEEEMEIGIIKDLDAFPQADADLVRAALERRYFIHVITRINHVGWKFGFIHMDVVTDKGPLVFLMPWRHDRAFDYGKQGKILIDLDENRYLIPDVDKLPTRERNDFQRYIYW
jgi:hypothetical protein